MESHVRLRRVPTEGTAGAVFRRPVTTPRHHDRVASQGCARPARPERVQRDFWGAGALRPAGGTAAADVWYDSLYEQRADGATSASKARYQTISTRTARGGVG